MLFRNRGSGIRGFDVAVVMVRFELVDVLTYMHVLTVFADVSSACQISIIKDGNVITDGVVPGKTFYKIR